MQVPVSHLVTCEWIKLLFWFLHAYLKVRKLSVRLDSINRRGDLKSKKESGSEQFYRYGLMLNIRIIPVIQPLLKQSRLTYLGCGALFPQAKLKNIFQLWEVMIKTPIPVLYILIKRIFETDMLCIF